MRLLPHIALRATLVISFTLMAFHANASPNNGLTPNSVQLVATDELDTFVSNRGLMSQFSQVRQNVGDRASRLVENAMGFLGVRYRRGGNSEETGFDCSGFVRATYEQTIGLLLPRKAEQQAAATQKIDRTDLKPGDLVFFNTMRRAFSHVGIYVGDDKFIHAPRPGASVRVDSMEMSYWSHRFDGARRVTSGGDNAASGALTAQQAAALMGQSMSALPTTAAAGYQALSGADNIR
jgi:cell wall-associated NlpC family hydrolase